MPSSVGPNTFGEENLVFGYDLGDNKNSFPGIPAVNCATVPASASNWTVTEVTDGSISPPRKGARVFKFVCNNTSNLHRQGGYYSGGGFGGSNPNPLILGKTSPSNFTTVGTGKYRFGMWVRGAASNSTAWWTIDIGDRNASNITVNNNTDWQFVSTTDAAGIASTSYPYDFFDINGTNGQTYYVADYGIFRSPGTVDSLPALQAYPQWVDYQQERSYTAGLKDITGNSTIDLTNVSFDSNAQITFDGTDDEINTGITTQLTDFSCEVVFKNNNSQAWGRLVDKSYTDGFFISAYFATSGIGYVGAGIIEPSPPHGQALQYDTSKYNYFVVTRSGTTHTIYLNGSTNYSSKTGSSTSLSNVEMAIGAWYGSTATQRYTGEIPVVKLYNRALTADEVQRNFNAIKGRFNI
jgi:hypothetical protein